MGLPDNSGSTCLHEAVHRGHVGVVRLLVGLPGAVVLGLLCHQSNAGLTPLHMAAASGDVDVVRLLLGASHLLPTITTTTTPPTTTTTPPTSTATPPTTNTAAATNSMIVTISVTTHTTNTSNITGTDTTSTGTNNIATNIANTNTSTMADALHTMLMAQDIKGHTPEQVARDHGHDAIAQLLQFATSQLLRLQ